MSSDPSANFDALVSREQTADVINAALRIFVGRGKRYSVAELAGETGVPKRAIECAMTEGYDHRSLQDWQLFSISKFIGKPFWKVWMASVEDGADVDAAYLASLKFARDCLDDVIDHMGGEEMSNVAKIRDRVRAGWPA